MAEIRVALPPYSEQAAISAWLRERTDNFNILTSEAEAAITLLRERRSALISAAVTGKIDIRGFAPAEVEAA